NDVYLEDLASLLPEMEVVPMKQALHGADFFLGLSAAGLITGKEVKSMGKNPIVFALANPDPEIMPQEASHAGAAVVATGRSDFPNQINNVLAFPGIFSALIKKRQTILSDAAKIRAAEAIASCVTPGQLKRGIIIPGVFSRGVVDRIIEVL
ncbi:MAG: NAD-dependent malic enzyme, partial [Candidatus Wallbacteria bacterium]|nr:NAD-dependent malic enzyme [Candidatus Wallbacteria bacterium]